jgi:hypothetical protein
VAKNQVLENHEGRTYTNDLQLASWLLASAKLPLERIAENPADLRQALCIFSDPGGDIFSLARTYQNGAAAPAKLLFDTYHQLLSGVKNLVQTVGVR